jgi:hypothetical protein
VRSTLSRQRRYVRVRHEQRASHPTGCRRAACHSGNRLKVKVTVRDLPYLRDPAVLLIDQLKEVYIDGELETVDTTFYLPDSRDLRSRCRGL